MRAGRQAGRRLSREQPVAQVSISFNQRSYRFECGDTDADRIARLANHVKQTLDKLIAEHGAIGDERLVLMAALMITDELFEARDDIDDLLDDNTDRLKIIASDMTEISTDRSSAPNDPFGNTPGKSSRVGSAGRDTNER